MKISQSTNVLSPIAFARSIGPSRLTIVLLVLIWTGSAVSSWAHSRLVPEIEFEQPDGTVIELRGFGNEYRAVYETLDGYTVVFVPESKAYFYATLSETGDELISSGIQVGQGDPPERGIEAGVRVRPEAARAQTRRAREEWESKMGISERWAKMKAAAKAGGDLQSMNLRYRNTIGTKVGLTLLIDFDGTPAPVPRSNIVQFLNGDKYRANGNQGSVKEYFAEVSSGKLTYTNIVVGYIRIPKSLRPRTYYDDPNRSTFDSGSELIRDAIKLMTNQPNYMTEIVPQLEALSVNEKEEAVALNAFVAGPNSGVWAKGLWPSAGYLSDHVGPQELWPGGKKVNNYQMTLMPSGSTLGIGVFCHETGHLLCDFPDIYDYDETSSGGAGNFCLMDGAAGYNGNPQHVNAYLKLMAGWATVTDIRPGPATTFTLNAVGTNENHFLRYQPFPLSTEYYLIENRQKTGRDAVIPGSGILVWHIDELGNSMNENLLPNSVHANYEITLVQADGRWDLQRSEEGSHEGDATDPFYRSNPAPGYENRFADDTTPGALWWNGYRSGLELRDFSVRSNRMTLVAEVKPPRILRDPISQQINAQDDLFLSVQMATNLNYTYRWFKGDAPLSSSERVTGVDGPVLVIAGVTSADAGEYSVVIIDDAGHSETSRVAQVSISSLRRLASQDIGDAARMSGATTILENSFYISAAGSGIAGGADGGRLLFETLSGDFDARLQIIDMNFEQALIFNDLLYSKHQGGAGIMIRAGLEPGDAQAAVLVRHRGLLENARLQAVGRSRRGESVKELAQAAEILPRNNWVRLKREGTLVSMYYSINPARWDWLETVSLPLESEALVGIAASSYNPVTRIVTTVRSYSVSTNAPPTFAISALKNSAIEGANDSAVLQVVSSRNGPLEIPYTARDSGGVAYTPLSGTLTLPAGTNIALLEIVPINDADEAMPQTVTVTFTSSGVSQSSASVILFDDDQQGHGLKKESYTTIPGTAVRDLTSHFRYPDSATLNTVTNFESFIPQSSGQVLSGFITPPTTGMYTFYLASVNAAELWLSTDPNPENAVKIAEETAANGRRNWPGYGSQAHISMPIPLTQGRWYFVRAIHKAGLGSGVTAPYLALRGSCQKARLLPPEPSRSVENIYPGFCHRPPQRREVLCE